MRTRARSGSGSAPAAGRTEDLAFLFLPRRNALAGAQRRSAPEPATFGAATLAFGDGAAVPAEGAPFAAVGERATVRHGREPRSRR